MLIVFDSRTNYQKIDYDGESFVKGDYSVHTIDVLMKHDAEYDTYTYTGSLQFKRSDGQTSPKLVMSPKKIEYDGKVYNGYTFKMEGDWFTEISGVLKMAVSISTYNEGETGASTNKAYANIEINVEDSVVETIPTTITDEEYTALMNKLNSKLSVEDQNVKFIGGSFGDIESLVRACYERYIKGVNEMFRGGILTGNQYNVYLAVVSTTTLNNNTTKKAIVIGSDGVMYYYDQNLSKQTLTFYRADFYSLNATNVNVSDRVNAKNILSTNIEVNTNGTFDGTKAQVKVATPTEDNHAANKKYVDDSFSKEVLIANIGLATNQSTGLMSAEDKQNIEAFKALLNDKNSAFVDSLTELLAIFNKYPQGTDIVELLASKANKNETYTKEEIDVLLSQKSEVKVDNVVTESSNNAVSSAAVYAYVEKRLEESVKGSVSVILTSDY